MATLVARPVFACHTNIVDGSLFANYADSMKSDAFNHMIATALTTPKKTVIVYARLLKEAGLLTTGARGRHAPEMTPLDAARMTLAILTTESPSQCVERVRRFGQIKYSPTYKKRIRGYETIQPDQFDTLFKGETLEEVLAYIFSLPAVIGVAESAKWYGDNPFHLRVSDFDVLAELFKWNAENGEIIGEAVVPFKGEVMIQTAEGFRHTDAFAAIKGGVRTQRSTAAATFTQIGFGLLHDEQYLEEDV